MAEPTKRNYTVKINEDMEQGVFANAVSVHFNNNECVIDMAYTIPNSPEPTIKVVSRINMTHKTAESFMKVLTDTFLDWKNKQKKQ